MKKYSTNEETYFLGGGTAKKHSRMALCKKVAAAVVCAAVIIAVVGLAFLRGERTGVSGSNVLKTVAVLPEGGHMPVFNGNGDVSDFLKWVMTNLKYPQGLDNTPARVVICFDVKTDGTLGNYHVLEAPKEKAFEQTVIELLDKSPRWKPARLSSGEEVNMEFTLPVVFTPEVKNK